MITRALTAIVLLSATCLTCYAQDPTNSDSNASIVTRGRPVSKITPDLAAGLDGAHHAGWGQGLACVPMRHDHNFKQILERSGITLSDDQVEKMTSLRSDLMKNLMPKKDHAISLAGDLKETLTAAEVNDDQVRKIFADLKTDIDAAYAKFVDHVIAVSHVFTADQRQKLRVSIDRWSLGPLGHTAPPAGSGPAKVTEP